MRSVPPPTRVESKSISLAINQSLAAGQKNWGELGDIQPPIRVAEERGPDKTVYSRPAPGGRLKGRWFTASAENADGRS